MAKLLRAPIEPPDLDIGPDFDADEYLRGLDAYDAQLAALAKQNAQNAPNVELLGEIIRFPRGDGQARYMVWRTRPLELVWIQTGDAWSVEPALIRGLRLSDVREQVEREHRARELFGRGSVA